MEIRSLARWMKSKGAEKSHTKLVISMDRFVQDYSGTGNQRRYLRVFIGGEDVSQMVGDFVGLHVSKAKGTNGCVILHGCGMDMMYCLQSKAFRNACIEGFPEMFDDQEYEYLGRNKHPKE